MTLLLHQTLAITFIYNPLHISFDWGISFKQLTMVQIAMRCVLQVSIIIPQVFQSTILIWVPGDPECYQDPILAWIHIRSDGVVAYFILRHLWHYSTSYMDTYRNWPYYETVKDPLTYVYVHLDPAFDPDH